MAILYTYDGPVYEFENCINRRWLGSTYADSELKARNNLSYQYKRQYKRSVSSKLRLPGKLTAHYPERSK